VLVTRDSRGLVSVRHGFDADRLDDDIAEMLAAALAPITDDHRIFQAAFVGIVETTDPDQERAWRCFYRNSLARIDDPTRGGYVDVHRHALLLLRGHDSVLDLGCGLGFLAILLARRRVRTVAADLEPGTVRLVAGMSARLRSPLTAVRCGAGGVPLPARSVEAAVLLHVLEHTDHAEGEALVGEALRIARRRVVVAVPHEDRPNALFGHVRVLTHEDLVGIGGRSGWSYRVHDFHGGWLVLDRPTATGGGVPPLGR
jgi:SAM-dependent methyltransferase